jgi:hypothetical protein
MGQQVIVKIRAEKDDANQDNEFIKRNNGQWLKFQF